MVSPTQYPNYGYNVYIPNVIRWNLSCKKSKPTSQEEHEALQSLFPIFVDAAWELCRRGIIRPGVHNHAAQSTPEGSGGSGYSITSFGHQWLKEEDKDVFIPTEPERFAQMIEPFRKRFGAGFHERAQEAIRCYDAHAYLACCTMCGAAAESILLATAISMSGKEDEVLKTYTTASGRKRIESIVVGQANEHIKREFQGLTQLLKYWRDEAAHGKNFTNIRQRSIYITCYAIKVRYVHPRQLEFSYRQGCITTLQSYRVWF